MEKEKESKAKTALKTYAGMFRDNPDISGFGIGSLDGEPYIQIFVKKGRAKQLEKSIPDELGDYPVYYIEAGPFRAL